MADDPRHRGLLVSDEPRKDGSPAASADVHPAVRNLFEERYEDGTRSGRPSLPIAIESGGEQLIKLAIVPVDDQDVSISLPVRTPFDRGVRRDRVGARDRSRPSTGIGPVPSSAEPATIV